MVYWYTLHQQCYKGVALVFSIISSIKILKFDIIDTSGYDERDMIRYDEVRRNFFKDRLHIDLGPRSGDKWEEFKRNDNTICKFKF